MSSFASGLIIAGCVVHSLLSLLLPVGHSDNSGTVRYIQALLEFEVYLNLNTIISIFVRSQTILAATAGSNFSIALGWALLRTGGSSIGVLDVDHQKLGNLFKLFRSTKQKHVRLLCFAGLFIAITIGLEGIVLQQMLRGGPYATYPFTSMIYIPEIEIPTHRNYLFSEVSGQPISFTGVGSGIALKALGDVALLQLSSTGDRFVVFEQDPLIGCSYEGAKCKGTFTMPLDFMVECSNKTTKSSKIDSQGTFVQSISTSYPPTTQWIVRKWNETVNVTHTCNITAGKSVWSEVFSIGKGMWSKGVFTIGPPTPRAEVSRSDFQKYEFSPSDRAEGPAFIASGMAGSLGRLLNGECWGYVNSTAVPFVCSSVMSAMTNTIDRNVAPGVGTEAEMKYVIDRLARRLAAELMTSKEIECQNCEDRLRRYVLPTFKIITIFINLIIIILATATIVITRNVGPVSNDIVTILKLGRNLNENDLNDKEIVEKEFFIEGNGDEAVLKVMPNFHNK
ncbi:hypothetical protein BC833DRAFT_611902 [Globomyces pollinis-pini]|nr:hypothetical protein BC833DRAFT_611902 [Globomyces pollinis-pini]